MTEDRLNPMQGLPTERWSPRWRYLIAIGITGAALLISWWLSETTMQPTLVWNLGAVALVVAVAGTGPAAIAVAVTTLAIPLLVTSRGYPFLQRGTDVLIPLGYLIAGGFILLLGARVRNNRLRLARALVREEAISRDLEIERVGLAAVIDQLPNGVVITDADGQVRLRNRKVEEITGAAAGTGRLAAAPMPSLRRHGIPIAPDQWPLTRSLRDGEVVQGEEADFFADGERRVLRASSAPVRDPSGEIVAGVMIFADVTERRRIEDHARLAADVADALDTDTLLAERLRSVADLMVSRLADTCLIELAAPRRLVAVAERSQTDLGSPTGQVAAASDAEENTGAMGRVLRSGEPYLNRRIDQVEGGRPDLSGRPELERIIDAAGWCSLLILPMRVGRRVVGAIALATTDPEHRLGSADLVMAMDLAARVGTAVENARYHEESERSRRQEERTNRLLRSLQDATAAAASGLTVEEVVAASRRGLEALESECTWVVVKRGDQMEVFAWPREAVAPTRSVVDLNDESALGFVALSGRALWHPPLVPGTARSRRMEAMADEEGLGVIAVIPIAVGGEVLGAFCVGFDDPDRLDPPNRRYLTAMGDVMGRSLLRARRYEQEHEVAEALQRDLLPRRLPPVPGLDVAVRYLAEVDQSVAGGDWYDLISIGDGRVALVLGDVVGHGVVVASTMGRLRTLLGAYLVEGDSPAKAIARLDAAVARIPEALGTTVVCASIDLERGTLIYASAGHPPPVLLSATGVTLLGDGRTVPLGAGNGEGCIEGAVALDPGDRLVFYSDGLVERRGESLEVGTGHLAGLVAAIGRQPPQMMADEILAALVGDEPVGDDICLLVAGVGDRVVLPSPPPLDEPAATGLPVRPGTET